MRFFARARACSLRLFLDVSARLIQPSECQRFNLPLPFLGAPPMPFQKSCAMYGPIRPRQQNARDIIAISLPTCVHFGSLVSQHSCFCPGRALAGILPLLAQPCEGFLGDAGWMGLRGCDFCRKGLAFIRCQLCKVHKNSQDPEGNSESICDPLRYAVTLPVKCRKSSWLVCAQEVQALEWFLGELLWNATCAEKTQDICIGFIEEQLISYKLQHKKPTGSKSCFYIYLLYYYVLLFWVEYWHAKVFIRSRMCPCRWNWIAAAAPLKDAWNVTWNVCTCSCNML